MNRNPLISSPNFHHRSFFSPNSSLITSTATYRNIPTAILVSSESNNSDILSRNTPTMTPSGVNNEKMITRTAPIFVFYDSFFA